MIRWLIWTIWTSLSAVPRKAVKFNRSLTHLSDCLCTCGCPALTADPWPFCMSLALPALCTQIWIWIWPHQRLQWWPIRPSYHVKCLWSSLYLTDEQNSAVKLNILCITMPRKQTIEILSCTILDVNMSSYLSYWFSCKALCKMGLLFSWLKIFCQKLTNSANRSITRLGRSTHMIELLT